MALIKLSGIVTAISGKMGGTSFGTSASGAYAKNSGTPRKSLTLSQKGKMALMGTTSQRWRGLTQTQRDTFNAASPDYPYLNRVGETKFYSGYAIFTQLVNNLAGNSFSVTPVPLPKFSFTPLTNLDFTDPYNEGFFEGRNGQEGVVYRLFVTRVSSVGISSPYKNHFYMSQEVTPVGNVIYIPYGAEYAAKWGQPPASGKLYYRVDAVQVSTGQIYKGLHSGSLIY